MTESGSCVIWVDRHVHKNAGTSVREAMQALHAAGWLQRLGGYGSPLDRWLTLTRALGTLRPPCDPSVAATRIALRPRRIATQPPTQSCAERWHVTAMPTAIPAAERRDRPHSPHFRQVSIKSSSTKHPKRLCATTHDNAGIETGASHRSVSLHPTPAAG